MAKIHDTGATDTYLRRALIGFIVGDVRRNEPPIVQRGGRQSCLERTPVYMRQRTFGSEGEMREEGATTTTTTTTPAQ